MSFKYIFDECASKVGIDPELNDGQRQWLIRQINIAAKRLYRRKDLPFQLKEIFVRITNNQTVILPGFIGEIRAMRSQEWEDKWTLNDIRPRYSQSDWPIMWNKARIIGEVPIATELTNAGPFSYEYPVIDSSLIITTVGETMLSNREIDSITMDAAIKSGTKSFTDVTRLAKNAVSTYNVTVKDADGNQIATIYADQLESRYFVVDISAYPTIQDCSDGTFVMEVLYKPALPYMSNDEDAFPLSDYDDIIVKMTLQVIEEDEPGKEERAILKDSQTKELVDDIIQDKTGTTNKKMFMADNPLYDLFPKYNDRGGCY